MATSSSLAWHEWVAAGTVAIAAIVFSTLKPGFPVLAALVASLGVSGLSLAMRIHGTVEPAAPPAKRFVSDTLAGLLAILALGSLYALAQVFL